MIYSYDIFVHGTLFMCRLCAVHTQRSRAPRSGMSQQVDWEELEGATRGRKVFFSCPSPRFYTYSTAVAQLGNECRAYAEEDLEKTWQVEHFE